MKTFSMWVGGALLAAGMLVGTVHPEQVRQAQAKDGPLCIPHVNCQ